MEDCQKRVAEEKKELDVNSMQRSLLLQCTGVARLAFNWGLVRRKEEYESFGKSSNAIEQYHQLSALQAIEYPWFYNYPKSIPQEALWDLDKACQNFFHLSKNGKKNSGFPKFKSHKNGMGSFRVTGAIRIEDGRIRLPRIGWLRLREHGCIPTDGIHVLSATVSEVVGWWFVSVQCREDTKVRGI